MTLLLLKETFVSFFQQAGCSVTSTDEPQPCLRGHSSAPVLFTALSNPHFNIGRVSNILFHILAPSTLGGHRPLTIATFREGSTCFGRDLSSHLGYVLQIFLFALWFQFPLLAKPISWRRNADQDEDAVEHLTSHYWCIDLATTSKNWMTRRCSWANSAGQSLC